MNQHADLLIAEDIAATLVSEKRWRDLQGARLFVTGCTGLFGRWLLPALLQANRTFGLNLAVTALTRNVAAARREFSAFPDIESIRWWEGDVRSFAFPPGDIDLVVHGATTSAHETYGGENSLNKFMMLFDGTSRVMKFAAEKSARRVVFLSSGVVYGPLSAGMQHIPETFLAAPETTDTHTGLAHGKRAAEYLCAEYARMAGFELAIARCFSFAGPGLPTDIHYALGNFVSQALRGESLVIRGDGTPMRSYLYLADMVQWVLPLLVEPLHYPVFNIGSDEAVSVLDLAQRVRDLIHPQGEIQVLGEKKYAVGNVSRDIYVPDIQRMRQEYGVDVTTDLSTTILRLAEYERLKLAGASSRARQEAACS